MVIFAGSSSTPSPALNAVRGLESVKNWLVTSIVLARFCFLLCNTVNEMEKSFHRDTSLTSKIKKGRMGASGEGFWFLDGSFRLHWAGNHTGILTRERHDQIWVWEAALTSAWKTSRGVTGQCRKAVQSWGKGEGLDQGKHWELKGQRTDLDISGGKVYIFYSFSLSLSLLLWLPPCFSHIRHSLASWPFSLPRLLCP